MIFFDNPPPAQPWLSRKLRGSTQQTELRQAARERWLPCRAPKRRPPLSPSARALLQGRKTSGLTGNPTPAREPCLEPSRSPEAGDKAAGENRRGEERKETHRRAEPGRTPHGLRAQRPTAPASRDTASGQSARTRRETESPSGLPALRMRNAPLSASRSPTLSVRDVGAHAP